MVGCKQLSFSYCELSGATQSSPLAQIERIVACPSSFLAFLPDVWLHRFSPRSRIWRGRLGGVSARGTARAALAPPPMSAGAPPEVVLYSTTTPALAKVKADIARLRRILDNKRVQYEEVGGKRVEGERGAQPWARRAALRARVLPALQVDLASTPARRADMLAGSDGLKTIPQLHVNGRVRAAALGARTRACVPACQPARHAGSVPLRALSAGLGAPTLAATARCRPTPHAVHWRRRHGPGTRGLCRARLFPERRGVCCGRGCSGRGGCSTGCSGRGGCSRGGGCSKGGSGRGGGGPRGCGRGGCGRGGSGRGCCSRGCSSRGGGG
jgi:hypothetical protein